MPGLNLKGRACAKINLGLRILGLRSDGYHQLRTVFQTLSLADDLELEIKPGRGAPLLELTGEDDTRMDEVPEGEANLAARAALLAADAFGVRGRLSLRLHKRIPVGAGLGGGSSDAACVLRMMALAAERQGRPVGEPQLGELAAALGSDVAPFILGGTVLGLGRGEEVYSLADLPPWSCVLVMPRGGNAGSVATPRAFRLWDEAQAARGVQAPLTARSASATMDFLSRLAKQHRQAPAPRLGRGRGVEIGASCQHRAPLAPKVHAGIENDFSQVVFSLSPDFLRIQRQLRRSRAVWVGLSGSGAAQYGLFAGRQAAEAARAALAVRDRAWTARFVSRGEYGRTIRVVAGR